LTSQPVSRETGFAGWWPVSDVRGLSPDVLSGAAVNCPYCGEQINAGVTVCKTCHRDIALVVSLKETNHTLEQRVTELETELEELRKSAPAESQSTTATEPPPSRRMSVVDVLAVYLALPTVVLVGIHYLLVIKFDTSLIWLRAASIVLPVVFGLVLERKARPRWFATLALGIVVAFASVFGMSTMVYFTDGDSILPNSAITWRETLEYVASISLAYLLGALIVHALLRPIGSKSARDSGKVRKLATFVAQHLSGKTKGKSLEEQVQRVIKFINLAISAATAIGAVYAGFKGIL